MTEPTTVEAPAKLTLSLRMTGVRDDGYHLIDAEMVILDLADRLTFEHRDGEPLTMSADGPFSAGMPVDDSNLVLRALRLAGVDGGVHVHVHKAIPHGGGLGGGSADAAAALRWAGWTPTADHLLVASRLGADIPFCLAGSSIGASGRARVRGIGEQIEPLPFVPLALTLVIPPLTVSTPAAYRAWDELAAADPGAAHAGDNELAAAALVVEPALVRWRDRITEAAGVAPTLAGSGATWFLRGHHPAVAEALPDAMVVPTRTSEPVRD